MNIRYLTHEQINFDQWDNCIKQAGNSLIYASSFYLNKICKHWDALIYEDYEMVMPLTFRKKYGITYLYQPAFAQQLGIFSRSTITALHTEAFLTEAKKHFTYAQIMLNYANSNSGNLEGITLLRKENFLLPLSHPYSEVCQNYTPGFEKSLRRLKKWELTYSKANVHEKILALYKTALAKYPNAPKTPDYTAFQEICVDLEINKKLVVRSILNRSQEIISAAILLRDEHRLYNMVSWANAEGKQKEANYLLYDKIIAEFSGEISFLDLEGSDLEGVASFYKKMNPISQPYYFAHFNRLPFWIRWLKP